MRLLLLSSILHLRRLEHADVLLRLLRRSHNALHWLCETVLGAWCCLLLLLVLIEMLHALVAALRMHSGRCLSPRTIALLLKGHWARRRGMTDLLLW